MYATSSSSSMSYHSKDELAWKADALVLDNNVEERHAPEKDPDRIRCAPNATTLARHQRRRRRRPTESPAMVKNLKFGTIAILLSLALALLALPAKASPGDRSPEYQHCVSSCTSDSCSGDPDWDDGVAHTTQLPLVLRLTLWNCMDDCRYHCTHRVTNEAYTRVRNIREDVKSQVEGLAKAEGWTMAKQRNAAEEIVKQRLDRLRPVQKEMVQYHGKWVFIRFLGCQEPLSVLFSLMNFGVHIKAVHQLRKQVPDAFPIKLLYILHALASCNAWFWSAIFHARDKAFTERLDYFSAGTVVFGGWFLAVSRLFRLAPGTNAFRILLRVCSVCLILHILYLSIGRFDYSYNMKINVIVGLSHSFLWLLYSLAPTTVASWGLSGTSLTDRFSSSRAAMRASEPPSVIAPASSTHPPLTNGGSPPAPVSTAIPPPSSSRKARHQLQRIIFLLLGASALEIFDFPPFLRALDAHSLWHLATVPLALMWYAWIIEDARECVTSGFFVGEGIKGPKLLTEGGAVAAEVVAPALEKAREWASSAASSAAATARHQGWDLQGATSGVELNALTNKLNALARSTLNGTVMGNSGVGPSLSATEREKEKQKELGNRGVV